MIGKLLKLHQGLKLSIIKIQTEILTVFGHVYLNIFQENIITYNTFY